MTNAVAFLFNLVGTKERGKKTLYWGHVIPYCGIVAYWLSVVALLSISIIFFRAPKRIAIFIVAVLSISSTWRPNRQWCKLSCLNNWVGGWWKSQMETILKWKVSLDKQLGILMTMERQANSIKLFLLTRCPYFSFYHYLFAQIIHPLLLCVFISPSLLLYSCPLCIPA